MYGPAASFLYLEPELQHILLPALATYYVLASHASYGKLYGSEVSDMSYASYSKPRGRCRMMTTTL